ncbi:hydroxymethylglutaryl-CoA lyase [Anaerosporomusa subterranea]|uniref:Hydroxymethylglutaryl-CoA lyase n=1 Tax=Anaerosporomusa subterranea TaxID=1794912 RepID=A0A154BQ59_ANASB|nr:hydroxymethylglutaryl-CoA lyase [Anaerosporomusa subterranea]KYZ76000.1 hydroxymethylglutaryl-CoA lyase [Anaerosporomusa subterranea]
MELTAKRIEVTEVGPRDGFQNVKTFIPTQDKVEIIKGLIESGIKSLELTSFVSPKAIPQLADSTAVCQSILEQYGGRIKASALVPNLKGAQAAWDAGIREVACVVSVTPEHNKANINRTHDESLAEIAKMVEGLPGMKVRVDLATALACPFTGWVLPDAVAALAKKVTALGINKLVLADTIGVATPDRVHALAVRMQRDFPDVSFSLHLHDTRGMGLANTLAGVMAGITTFETSVGGLGGCPFAPGAAGNTATEDMVSMFNEMGIETGVDMEKLLQVVGVVGNKVDAPLSSHMAKAKIYDCFQRAR